MLNQLVCSRSEWRLSVGLLVFRLVMGAAMALHGWPKIQNAFVWMGFDAPTPGWLQALAAFSEFGGGIALMLGFLTPLASLGLLATMFGAMFLVHWPQGDPFVSRQGGASYELALVYWSGALLYLLSGPGRFSLDYWLLAQCSRNKTDDLDRS